MKLYLSYVRGKAIWWATNIKVRKGCSWIISLKPQKTHLNPLLSLATIILSCFKQFNCLKPLSAFILVANTRLPVLITKHLHYCAQLIIRLSLVIVISKSGLNLIWNLKLCFWKLPGDLLPQVLPQAIYCITWHAVSQQHQIQNIWRPSWVLCTFFNSFEYQL